MKLKNKIKSYNFNKDIKDNLYILKNNDFLNIQKKFIDVESEFNSNYAYKTLYSKLINGTLLSSLSSNTISEEELKILNYILKYKKGLYQKNEIIAEINDTSKSETISLYDKGYYLIEISTQGQNYDVDFLSEDKSYQNIYTLNTWKSSDGFILNFSDNFSWKLTQNNTSFGGKFEITDDYIFLYKSNNIETNKYISFNSTGYCISDTIDEIKNSSSTYNAWENNDIVFYADSSLDELSIIDKDDYSLLHNGDFIYDSENNIYTYVNNKIKFNAKTDYYAYSTYDKYDIYDYFKISIDLLDNPNLFGHLIFQLNKYDFYIDESKLRTSSLYGSVSLTSGGIHKYTSIFKDMPDGYYSQKFKELIENENISTITINSIAFNTAQYISKIKTINKGKYGVNGGHLYFILKLDNSKNFSFTYSKNAQGNLILKSSDDKITATATYETTYQSRSNKASKTSLVEKVTTCLGDASIYDECNVEKDGCIVLNYYNSTYSIRGGGGQGAGAKHNNFDVLCWNNNYENDFIKITFLGDSSLDISTIELNNNYKNNNSHPYANYHICQIFSNKTTIDSSELQVPKGSSIPLEYNIDRYYGNLLYSIDSDESYLESKDLYNKILYKDLNIYRDALVANSDSTIDITYYSNGGYFEYSDNELVKISNLNENYYAPSSIDDEIALCRCDFSNQDIDYDISLLCSYNNTILDDNDTYNALKKYSIINIKSSSLNNKNFYKNVLFNNNIIDCYQLSLSYKNILNLGTVLNYSGSETIYHSCEAKIVKATLYINDFNNPIDYIENSYIKVNSGTNIYIKIEFNSQRVKVSENESSFPKGTIFYNLRYDPINNKKEKYNLCENNNNTWTHDDFDYSYQYISFFMPKSSQNIQIYIECAKFKFKLLDDLYENLIITNLSNLDFMFEPYEPIKLNITMQHYCKISTLYKRNINSDYTTYINIYNDNINYESFFALGSSYDTLLNNSDSNNSDMYNKEVFNIDNTSILSKIFNNSINTSSLRREIYSICYPIDTENINMKCLYSDYNFKYLKNIIDETFILSFVGLECELTCRLTSDYLIGAKLLELAATNSDFIKIFKPMKLFGVISGGSTGDGGNALSGVDDSTKGYNGGCGGDGYIGGNGGDGGSTTTWGMDVKKWEDKVPSGFEVLGCRAGAGGAGGNGFFRNGGWGTSGTTILGVRKLKIYPNKDSLNYRCLTYTGMQFFGDIILKVKEQNGNENYQKPFFINFTCGNKGNTGYTGNSTTFTDEDGNAKTISNINGCGGGPGLPSFIEIYNVNNFYMDIVDLTIKNNNSNYYIYPKGHYNIYNLKKFILGPGIRGNVKTFCTYMSTQRYVNGFTFSVGDVSSGSENDDYGSVFLKSLSDCEIGALSTNHNTNISTYTNEAKINLQKFSPFVKNSVWNTNTNIYKYLQPYGIKSLIYEDMTEDEKQTNIFSENGGSYSMRLSGSLANKFKSKEDYTTEGNTDKIYDIIRSLTYDLGISESATNLESPISSTIITNSNDNSQIYLKYHVPALYDNNINNIIDEDKISTLLESSPRNSINFSFENALITLFVKSNDAFSKDPTLNNISNLSSYHENINYNSNNNSNLLQVNPTNNTCCVKCINFNNYINIYNYINNYFL